MDATHSQRCRLPQGAAINGQGNGPIIVFGVIGGAEAILGIDRFVVAREAQALGNLGDASQGFHQGPLRADGRGIDRWCQRPGLGFEAETVGQGVDQRLHALRFGARPDPNCLQDTRGAALGCASP